MANLTKAYVDRLETPTRRITVWDSTLAGFGVRVTPSGAKTFVVRYRPGAGGRAAPERWLTLGSYGPLTVEAARKAAKAALAAVALGDDPAAERAGERAAPTVGELISGWLVKEVAPKRKPSTTALYRIYADKHLLPALGEKKAYALTRGEVARLHAKLGEAAPVTANRAIIALSGAFTWAERHGLLPAGHANPCRAISKFRERGKERFLDSDELARLGATLALAESQGLPWHPDPAKPTAKHAPREENRRKVIDAHAVAAIRLLILTGCRLREILHLRWEQVDFERGFLNLPDSKTGRKSVVLSAPSLEVLSSIPRIGAFVIAGRSAGTKNEKPRADLHRPWAAVRRHAELEGVRVHDLRHTFAATGAGASLGLPIIGKLLGHATTATTEKYAHLAADPIRRAADQIAGTIAAAMRGNAAEIVSLGAVKKA